MYTLAWRTGHGITLQCSHNYTKPPHGRGGGGGGVFIVGGALMKRSRCGEGTRRVAQRGSWWVNNTYAFPIPYVPTDAVMAIRLQVGMWRMYELLAQIVHVHKTVFRLERFFDE